MQEGVDSEMLVLRKVTADPTVHRLASYLNRWRRIARDADWGPRGIRVDCWRRIRVQKMASDYWSLNLVWLSDYGCHQFLSGLILCI